MSDGGQPTTPADARRAALLAELAGYLDAEPSTRAVWCAHRARRELRELLEEEAGSLAAAADLDDLAGRATLERRRDLP